MRWEKRRVTETPTKYFWINTWQAHDGQTLGVGVGMRHCGTSSDPGSLQNGAWSQGGFVEKSPCFQTSLEWVAWGWRTPGPLILPSSHPGRLRLVIERGWLSPAGPSFSGPQMFEPVPLQGPIDICTMVTGPIPGGVRAAVNSWRGHSPLGMGSSQLGSSRYLTSWSKTNADHVLCSRIA